MEKDKKIDPLTGDELRHHTFDGIQEFDKKLPNWWLSTLYGAIAFSFGFWVWLHAYPGVTTPLSGAQLLKMEMQRRDELAAKNPQAVLTDKQLWDMSRDPVKVEKGHAIFLQNCVTCHGPEGKGKIGPNLTDEKRQWFHGRAPTQVLHTITEGVPSKGMITWKNSLTREQISLVASWVLSHHTTAADPKDFVEPNRSATPATAAPAPGAPTNPAPSATPAPPAPATPATATPEVKKT